MSYMEEIIAACGGIEQTILWGVVACLAMLCVLFVGKVLKGIGRCALGARNRLREKKKGREELGRRLQYALPDRENAYVRARLQSSLQEEPSAPDIERDKGSVGVRLGYTKKMLARVREATLSPVERLDVEEMAELVATYARMDRWSNGDIKAINEICARLLKLSAKYEIAV